MNASGGIGSTPALRDVSEATLRRMPLLAASVCIAALVAHAAVDFAGDWWFAHDAYDDIAHGSRLTVSVAIASLLIAAVATLLAPLFFDRGGRRLVRSASPPLRGGSLAAFVLATAGLGLAGMMAMEAADQFAAGRPVDDLAALLAGSPLPAATIALVCGLVTGLAIAFASRMVLAVGARLVATIVAWLRDRRRPATARALRTRTRAFVRRSHLLVRFGGDRAPPLRR